MPPGWRVGRRSGWPRRLVPDWPSSPSTSTCPPSWWSGSALTAELAASLAWLDANVNPEADPAPRAASMRLDRMRRVVALMGEPQRAYPVIHITGTNGKGSTARRITARRAARGLSGGTYTSPDLERVNERMAWNDEPIADAELAQALQAIGHLEAGLDEVPTRFEILTAAAFGWFADVAVDVAVLEVGLGGTWDATNVVDADVAVVTNISIDHTQYLGTTAAQIANEKAGIVKEKSILVLGETDPDLVPLFTDRGPARVLRRDADFGVQATAPALGGRVVDLFTPAATYPEVFVSLHGAHQADNAAVALAAAEAFAGAPLDD